MRCKVLPRILRRMLTIHRYVGLVLGAWLTLMGLSGAILVFSKEIEQGIDRKSTV